MGNQNDFLRAACLLLQARTTDQDTDDESIVMRQRRPAKGRDSQLC